jgi:DNA-binding LytR/AlgR family response regulator
MAKLNFNTRDELISIDLDLVAAFKADGSYTKAVYITQREYMLNATLSQVDEALAPYRQAGYKFLRLGRQIIINHKFLSRILVTQQLLILSKGDSHDLRIKIPKQVLRQYKEAVSQSGKQM